MIPRLNRERREQAARVRRALQLVVLLLVAAAVSTNLGGDMQSSNVTIGAVEKVFNHTGSSVIKSETKPESQYVGTDGRLQNLHLVFVGDSLSRYMYLSLLHFVKTGTWAPQGDLLLEKVKDDDPQAWNKWLAFTNQVFSGVEDCDCYRYWTKQFKWYRHCENRYYRDPTRNNSITFITKFGGNPFHGHWRPDIELRQDNWDDAPVHIQLGRPGLNQTLREYKWVYPTWDDLVHKYISKLKPKPSMVLFNQGHWKGHELREKTTLRAFRKALKEHNMKGVYRTTTFRSDEPNYEQYANAVTRKHDAVVCSFFSCLNISWTAYTPEDQYVDPVHFKASINNQMNQQFLREFYGINAVAQ